MKSFSSLSDEQLVLLCKQRNDSDAWRELCSRYLSVAKAQASKLSADPTEAEDLSQVGLIGFLSAVHSYNAQGKASFATYASHCIHNRIINTVKSSKAKRQIPADLCTPLDSQSELADTALTPEQILLSRKEAQRISKAICEKLTEKEQQVFSLYLSGLRYKEIAKKLSVSEKAVESALSRARKKLKDEFGNNS